MNENGNKLLKVGTNWRLISEMWNESPKHRSYYNFAGVTLTF